MPGAHHLIITAYGFWLPNDPRGSWSTWVRQPEIYRAGGPATKTTSRQSLAARPHDPAQRQAARKALRHPPVRFTGRQAQAVAQGLGQAIKEYDYTVYAAAIMPDHAHLVIASHNRTIQQIRQHLKGRATRSLNDRGLNPMPEGLSPWARKGWQVYLPRDQDIRRTIQYVENNPVKAGFKTQQWSWVSGYP